ncbi:MAG: hypothetical protein IJB31_03495 [Akkermansia sp.]|nr:hypothetical protein [Akkermansia sp.]
MKVFNLVALALAATACFTGTAMAQQKAGSALVKAYVQFEKGKPMNIALEPKQDGTKFFYIDKGTEQVMGADAAKCDLFYIQTPVDFAAAAKTYAGNDFDAARKQLAACKEKYKAYVGLPGNPCTKSAVLELECAIRQMKWNEVKELVASFPNPGALEFNDKALYEVAKIMGNVSDDPGALEAIKGAVETAKADKYINSSQYGWLMYALGRAYAAQIPADQLEGTIAEAKVADANLAIDTLCQAAVCSHGAQMEIPVDAMKRTMKLLWAMPGVKEYVAQANNMDVNKWNAAPYNFRDAVALAYLIKNVYAPETQDGTIDRLAKFHVNTLEGKEKPQAEPKSEE